MRILDRYIFKSTLSLFLGCLFIFFLLYVVVDIFAHLDEILRQKTGLQVLAQYYLSYLPLIFVQVAPIAGLLATLYTFARLNRFNEIIAMRAAGLSVLQISKTPIILGIILSLCVFWVNDKFVPRSITMNEKIKSQMEGQNSKKPQKSAESLSNLSMYGSKNRLFFVNSFNFSTNTMKGITILEQDTNQNITRKIVANKGVYNNGLWTFYQSITYDFDANGQIMHEPQYLQEEIMGIPESPKDFLSQRQRPEFMNIAELDNYILKLSNSGATTVIRNLKVDLYQRFTFCLTSIIIMLLGIPFALMIKKRSAGLSSIGLAITVGFCYYVLNAISIALGKAGIITPLLAVSLSHILILTLSVYLISSLP
jgi:lipopolysaccharide export system permease protein